MNIEAWNAVAALAGASAVTWIVCRWWYLRRMQHMSRQMLKLDAVHQNTLRMAAQARKQIEELQRLTEEYRRRLTAVELARRPRRPPAAASAADPTAAVPTRNIPTLTDRPGGWADTQPL